MYQETEQFDDGRTTTRTYDADDRLTCIETFAAGDLLAAERDLDMAQHRRPDAAAVTVAGPHAAPVHSQSTAGTAMQRRN